MSEIAVRLTSTLICPSAIPKVCSRCSLSFLSSLHFLEAQYSILMFWRSYCFFLFAPLCLKASLVLASRNSLNTDFCSFAGEVTEKREALGEVLNGDRMVEALYELKFKQDKEMEILCEKPLTKNDIKKFRDAVKNDYYFQMYYDDLPIWGFVGKIEKSGQDVKYSLNTHVHFDIQYNDNRVIEISVDYEATNLVDITLDKEQTVKFTYTAKWKATDKPFSQRMAKYSRNSFLPQHLEIHWFSIINSCVTVLLLTGFLATILMRVLKNDFIK